MLSAAWLMQRAILISSGRVLDPDGALHRSMAADLLVEGDRIMPPSACATV
jgi:hypothetical protein